MLGKVDHLKDKLTILDDLRSCDRQDLETFKYKIDTLKSVALLLLEEIESLEYVRSVNIRRGISLPEELRTFEIHLIQSALERTGGHQTRAAQLLGINLTTLHNKLKRLNIKSEIQVNAPILHEDSPIMLEQTSENILRQPEDENSQYSVA